MISRLLTPITIAGKIECSYYRKTEGMKDERVYFKTDNDLKDMG